MALHRLFRLLRSKAPSLAQRISGDCSVGVRQFQSSDSELAQRALTCNGYSSFAVRTFNESNINLQRGYSSEASLDRDEGFAGPDSPSHNIVLENNSANEPTADGIKSLNFGPKISERHNLAMIFTCTVCETRSAKTMSRQTYETGVVIVRCGGCKNLHLIADHLGWFGEPGSVEDFLKHKGVEVRKGSEESYEFCVEDLAGWSPPVKK